MRFATLICAGVGILFGAVVSVVSYQQRSLAGEGRRPSITLLAPGNESAAQRLEYKVAVTRQLIEGKLTLFDAAAWFQYVNEATPAAGDDARPEDAGKSDGERYCLQVIRWAGALSRDASSSQSEGLVRRLQAELNGRLRRAGAVELPAVQ